MSKSTPVWKMLPKTYRAMRARHKALWRFLPAFIEEFGVRSLLEIGCGDAPLAERVPYYLGLELNETVARYAVDKLGRSVFVADWTTLDLTWDVPFGVFPWDPTWTGNHWEMALALAVVEHCRDYRPFIDKMLAVNPQFVIVSFFRGLCEGPDVIDERHENGVTYWENTYSRAGVQSYLARWGLAWNADRMANVTLPTANATDDLVLVLNPGEPVDDLNGRVARLAEVAIGGR